MGPIKRFEHALEIGFAHAAAGVTNGHGMRIDTNANLALLGEGHGVAQQVVEDDAQNPLRCPGPEQAIGRDPGRHIRPRNGARDLVQLVGDQVIQNG